MVNRGIVVFGLAFLMTFVLASCMTPRPPAGSEARTVNFRSGAPQFDAEADVSRRDGSLGVDVRWGVYPVSLIWTSPGGQIFSVVQTDIRLRDRESGVVITRHQDRDTLRVTSAEEARSYTYLPREIRIPAGAGTYTLDIEITDGNTSTARSRSIPVSIPASGEAARLAGIRIETSDEQPLLSLHVSPDLGEITARATLLSDEPRDVVGRFVQIESDTTAADPPFFMNRTRGSIRVRGVRAETSRVVAERVFENVQPFDEVAFPISMEAGGLYRVEFEADGQVTQRDLVVRQHAFPTINRLDVMADALTYLSTDREQRAITQSDSPAELRSRFNAFWLDAAGDDTAARQLLSLYYSRVEEANRRFSGVKEGWKTDRGMVFIVRGSPLFIERTLDREVWFYSYSQNNPAEIYSFERVPLFEFEGQFEQYVLERGPIYEYEWRRHVDRWRAGRAP
jgi:GWxTD domain-containing protein